MKRSNQLVVFSIDEQLYALPLSIVERIVRVVEITPLPEAPDIVLGLINVNGQIVPVLDICKCFHGRERELKLSDRLIIVHSSKQRFSLLVETVRGIIEPIEQEMVASDGIISGIRYVKGMIKQDAGMIFILDFDAILSNDEGISLNKVMKDTIGGKK